MALVFCDSFDHYATADRLKKWTADAGSGSPTVSSGGRFGNRLVCASSATAVNGLSKTVTSLATYVVGFAFQYDSLLAGDLIFFNVLDSGTSHLDLRLTNTGTVRITRNGTTLATGATVLSATTWYYLELKFTIADAPNGVYDLHINGVSEFSSSTADTRNGANASVNQIVLRGGSISGQSMSFDDFYLLTTSGGAPTNDFLGDVRIQALFPDGNGNSSNFDGSDGNSTDNYLLVDESTPNGDTDYVASGDVNDKDTYTYTNLSPGTGTVYGIQHLPYARKTDAGARSICTVDRLSATEVDSANKALTTTYLYLPDISEAKPGGGVWTVTDVNSAEFGHKVTV